MKGRGNWELLVEDVVRESTANLTLDDGDSTSRTTTTITTITTTITTTIITITTIIITITTTITTTGGKHKPVVASQSGDI